MTASDPCVIAKALGGEYASGAISCPGPGHSRIDRSLRVFLDSRSPTGYRVHSLAGDDWRACQAHVHRLIDFLSRTLGKTEVAVPIPPPHTDRPAATSASVQDEYGARKCSRAMAIYAESRQIKQTVAASYILTRMGPNAIPEVCDLQFHPKCPRGNQQRFPAIVALLRDIRNNTPCAIQRIFLRPDGADRLRDARGKMTLGPTKGCVLKLSSDADVTLGLGLAEGIETGLSILAAGWAPIWVTCGTSGMASFPLLAGIETLSLFADHDEAGERAALRCALRWADAGKHVRIVTPRVPGLDWGDRLREAV